MKLDNLNEPAQQVSFLQAVRLGLGERQGLFFPDRWPALDIPALLDDGIRAAQHCAVQSIDRR